MMNTGRMPSIRNDQRIAEEMRMERLQTLRTARQLSSEAERHWEKAVIGITALPAALSLRVAATALYTVAVVEKALEVFQLGAREFADSLYAEREERRDLAQVGPDAYDARAMRGRDARTNESPISSQS